MQPRFTCFISYPRLDDALFMRKFVDALEFALKETLKLHLGKTEFFVDVNQLTPGTRVDEGIAGALCDSLCLIAVYVPIYEQRTYCLREYEAMERLEKKRRALHAVLRRKGMIIPVIYRRHVDGLPEKITRYVPADLTGFAPTSQSLLRNRRFLREIETIAQHIVELKKAVGDADLCSDCDEFELPTAEEVKPWRPAPEPPFPR